MTLVVTTNVLMISGETDYPQYAETFMRINEVFLGVYVIELMLRFLTYKADALRDALTVIDIFLILLALVDRFFLERGSAQALPSLRLLRVFRLLRLLRIFRMSRELNNITANSLKGAFTFFWMVFFMALAAWIGAISCKAVIGESSRWNGSMDPLVEHGPFESFDRHEYFGSVSKSFLTLIQLVTLSQWADHFARQVVEVYPVLTVFISFFVLASSYALLVTVSSNIVRDAIVSSRKAEKIQQEIEHDKRARYGQRILKLVDKDRSGTITAEELMAALETTKLREIFQTLQVPELSADGLISLFDSDGDGCVCIAELIRGVVSMSEEIQPKDFLMLSLWVWNLDQRAQLLQQKLKTLHGDVVTLRKKLEAAFSAVRHFLGDVEEADLHKHALWNARNAPPPEPPDMPGVVVAAPRAPRYSALAEAAATAGAEAADSNDRQSQSPLPGATGQGKAVVRWVTIASPFVPMRDMPGPAANHVAALREGDMLEFEDLPEGPVRPEHLKSQPFLRCWKLDEKGNRTLRGWVSGYSPTSCTHFAPVEDASHERSGSRMPVVTVATTARQPGDPDRRKLSSFAEIDTSQQRRTKPWWEEDPGIPSDDSADKHQFRGTTPSPSLLQLKDLLT